MKTFEESTKYPRGIVSKPPSQYTVATKEPLVNNNKPTITHKNVTLDTGLEYLREFARRGTRHHALLMEHEDGTLHVSERTGQPCWGSLRTYGSKSTRPYDGWPGDLRTPARTFPDGLPVAVSVPGFSGANGEVKEFIQNEFLSSASPWAELGRDGDPEYIYKMDASLAGLMFKDTKIDPSLMVSVFRMGISNITGWYPKWKAISDAHPKLSKSTLWILSLANVTKEQVLAGNFTFSMYMFGGNPDIARIRDGLILEDLREGLFRDRFAYNRPVIDCIFGYDPPNATKTYQNKVFKDVYAFEEWFLNLKKWEY